MLTADTITDEQIRSLSDSSTADACHLALTLPPGLERDQWRAHIADILNAREASLSKWIRVAVDRCDICDRVAVWHHPEGGRRCKRCPRPDR